MIQHKPREMKTWIIRNPAEKDEGSKRTDCERKTYF